MSVQRQHNNSPFSIQIGQSIGWDCRVARCRKKRSPIFSKNCSKNNHISLKIKCCFSLQPKKLLCIQATFKSCPIWSHWLVVGVKNFTSPIATASHDKTHQIVCSLFAGKMRTFEQKSFAVVKLVQPTERLKNNQLTLIVCFLAMTHHRQFVVSIPRLSEPFCHLLGKISTMGTLFSK